MRKGVKRQFSRHMKEETIRYCGYNSISIYIYILNNE